MMQEKVRLINELDLRIKELENDVKALKKEKEILSQELCNEMQELGYDKLTVDGVTVYPRTDVYISIPKDNQEEALEWLKENGFGDYITETVNARTLTSVLKEELTDNPLLEDEIKELFNVSEKKRIGIRRN